MRNALTTITATIIALLGNAENSTPPIFRLNGYDKSSNRIQTIYVNNTKYSLYQNTLTIGKQSPKSCDYITLSVNWDAITAYICSHNSQTISLGTVSLTCINGQGAIVIDGIYINGVDQILLPAKHEVIPAIHKLNSIINNHFTNNN